MDYRIEIKKLYEGSGKLETFAQDQREPFEQYAKLRLKKLGLFLTLTGANKKASPMNKVVSIRVYDMQSSEGIRDAHMIFEIYPEGIMHTKTNLETDVSLKMFKLLCGIKPYSLVLALALAEEDYARQSDIEHVPLIRKNYLEGGLHQNFKNSAKAEDFFQMFSTVFKWRGNIDAILT